MPSSVLAEATRRKGNRAEALDAYRQLATGYPADPRGWLGLIRVAIESNDSRERAGNGAAHPPIDAVATGNAS
jgi:hypothetical protein